MNREEAKAILEMFRPGGADMADPKFTEALRLTEQDPELGRWFKDQRRFDLKMAAAIQTAVTVPDDLRASLLAPAKIVRPLRWQDWRAPAAVAAGFAVMAAAASLWLAPEPPKFATFRESLVTEAWDGNVHLELETSDASAIRQWLAAKNLPADIALPAGLRDARLLGCRIVEADGARVPMLCLVDGTRHLHLFVIDGLELAQPPPHNVPDFEKCGNWKTASWRDGGTTYVLTGMKMQTFFTKFRKGGRWTMSG